MKIDVWSDIACPYCCLGGIRLKKALRELDCEELFEIVPRSFQLEPELAGPGRPALRHYADKMGVEIEDLQEGLDRIVALAAGEGSSSALTGSLRPTPLMPIGLSSMRRRSACRT